MSDINSVVDQPVTAESITNDAQKIIEIVGKELRLRNTSISIEAKNAASWKIHPKESALLLSQEDNPIIKVTPTSTEINTETTSVKRLDIKKSCTIAPGACFDGVDVGSHNHSGQPGMGSKIPISSISGLQEILDMLFKKLS